MHNINALHTYGCITTASVAKRMAPRVLKLLPITPAYSLGLLHIALDKSSIYKVIKKGGLNYTDLGSQADPKHPFLKGG